MSKTTVSNNQAESTMASHADAIGHGNSPAAWTCVLVMLVGA